MFFRPFQRQPKLKAITPNEVIAFYDSYADYSAATGDWTVRIQGCVFDPRLRWLRRQAILGVVRRAARVDRNSDQLFHERMRQFLVDFRAGRHVIARIGDSEFAIGQSGPAGLFFGEARLNASRVAEWSQVDAHGLRWIEHAAALPESDAREFRGRTLLLPAEGLSIISDVDDTIKHSNVPNRKDLFLNTFSRSFRPVPGMAPLYQSLVARGIAFHYVSGSPWQLYDPLREFIRAEGYPNGSFHLKRFRLRDSARKLRLTPQLAHKQAVIEPLLRAFPGRRFILIGDSGEQDPEIYAHFLRTRPQQIQQVLIRGIRGETPAHPRFQRTFAGLDQQRWTVFHDSAEILPRIEPVLARCHC